MSEMKWLEEGTSVGFRVTRIENGFQAGCKAHHKTIIQ
jgi:hypothetical protein